MKKPFIERIHIKLRAVKDTLIYPLVIVLDKLKLHANHLSNLKIILSLFLFFTFNDLFLTTIIITAMLLLDALDGGLSRYQNTFNDKGHFLDTLSDHISTMIIVFCLSYFNYTNVSITSFHLFIYPIANLLSVIVYNEYRKSDWIIRPSPNLGYLKIPFILFLYLFLLFKINYLTEILYCLNIIYFILTAYFIFYIQYRWKKKNG